jgi:hypothetical protein
MWLRLAAHADVGVITGVDQALYRVHRDSMSRTTYAADLADLDQRHVAFHTFFESCGDLLKAPGALRSYEQRTTAKRALWRASRLSRLPESSSAEAARELAEFALRVDPGASGTIEYRVWGWMNRAQGPPSWARIPIAALAVRNRLRSWWFWRSRKWRCV